MIGTRFAVLAAVLLLALLSPGARAQAASCLQTASDTESFNACARSEILPLEGKVVSMVNGLRSKYKNDASLLATLMKSEEAWNTYRNNHCVVEAAAAAAAARGGAAEVEKHRAFAVCTKRALELRLRELEAL